MMSASPRPLTDSELMNLLTSRPRRLLLSGLMAEEVMTFEEIVEFIVAHDPERRPDDRDRVWAALHHHHLPKLAEVGLLEYDVRSETVQYYGDATVEVLLKVLGDRSLQDS